MEDKRKSTGHEDSEKIADAKRQRRFDRLKRWAAAQPREALEIHVIGLYSLLMLERKAMRSTGRQADAFANVAAHWADDAIEKTAELTRQRYARWRGAEAKKARDPKQTAKAAALELWKERHAGERPDLRTVEQFAIEVMRLHPVLESAKTIAGWSAKWTKQVRAGNNPTC